MLADYLAIATGVLVGLVWNIPIAVPTWPFWVATICALIWIFLSDYALQKRWMHAVWHFVSLVPLLVYVAVDLRPSQNNSKPDPSIELAAWIIFGLLVVIVTITTLWTYRYSTRNGFSAEIGHVFSTTIELSFT